jgi:hypothetical protein
VRHDRGHHGAKVLGRRRLALPSARQAIHAEIPLLRV